jgi:tetratricopeptide (TPR) repeat protein
MSDFRAGQAALEGSRIGEAIELLTKAIDSGALGHFMDDAYHRRAAAQTRNLSVPRQQRFETAILDYNAAIDHDRGNPWWHFGARGYAYLQLGDLEKAISDLTNAIRLEPAAKNFCWDRAAAHGRPPGITKQVIEQREQEQLGNGAAGARCDLEFRAESYREALFAKQSNAVSADEAMIELANNPVQNSYAGFFDATAEANDWDRIFRDESKIVAQSYGDGRLPGVTRIQRFHGDDRTVDEFWRWDKGGLHLFRVQNNKFVSLNRNRASGLFEEFENWDVLRNAGVVLSDENVERKANRIGNYFYVFSDRNDDGLVCVFFRQAFPVFPTGEYVVPSADHAGGEISAFECDEASGDVAEENLRQHIVTFLEALNTQ